MNPYNPNYDYTGAYNNSVNAYNQSAANTQAAQNNLQSFSKTMQNPSQMYAQDLTNAQQMYGFDPAQLLKAQQNLANTQTTLANLPQATQQQGNYYGTTAGAMANNYAQQAGNLQNVLAGQGNAVNAYNSVLGATQNQANQQATLGFQGQQLQAQTLQNLVNNALGFQGQQQQQEGVTQGEQSNYGNYLNALKNAQAAQTAAAAQMKTAEANSAATQQQIAQLNAIQTAFKSLYGNNWAAALAQLQNGQPITYGTTTAAPTLGLQGVSAPRLGLQTAGGGLQGF